MITMPLTQLRILVPESRELDLFADMLEKKGATVRRCPLVQILDLEDTRDASVWIDRLIAGDFRDVIWLTGEGVHRLLPLAEETGRRDAFVDALGHSRAITRGPKPARALRELGLKPWLPAAVPTSQGVLEALSGENLADRPIGVQLYPGDGYQVLLDGLRERGARVFPVLPYRYASDTDAAEVVKAIHDLAAGELDMIAFTSSAQLKRLLDVARDAGLESTLQRVFSNTPIAAIGPVVEAMLREQHVATILRPARSFHLKPLVNVIAEAWSTGAHSAAARRADS